MPLGVSTLVTSILPDMTSASEETHDIGHFSLSKSRLSPVDNRRKHLIHSFEGDKTPPEEFDNKETNG